MVEESGQAVVEPQPGSTLRLLGYAFVGWAGCTAAMVIGMAVATLQVALIIHAVVAPVWFGLVSWRWFSRYAGWSPVATAAAFTTFVIAVDFVLVAGVIQRNFEMFQSFLGTWLPFMLIFASTWIVGKVVGR